MQWLQRERDKNKGGTVLNIWKSETVIYETQKKKSNSDLPPLPAGLHSPF